MAGEIARILMKILNPQQAQWEEKSNEVPLDASPYTWQSARESVYGKGEDIELPAEPRVGDRLKQAAEGLKSFRKTTGVR